MISPLISQFPAHHLLYNESEFLIVKRFYHAVGILKIIQNGDEVAVDVVRKDYGRDLFLFDLINERRPVRITDDDQSEFVSTEIQRQSTCGGKDLCAIRDAVKEC